MNRWLPVMGTFAVILSFSAARAGDIWPCWRGPTGLGVTDEKNLPLTWGGKDNQNVLWKAPLPGGDTKAKFDHNQSSPIVWKDRVFLILVYWPEGAPQTSYPEHHVACYQTSDGKKLWDVKVEPGPWLLKDLRGGYSAPTPATDGERVYVLFGSSVLAALDFDGKLLWRTEVKPFGWDVAIGTSPVLHKDTVLMIADNRQVGETRLIAFDKKSGTVKWQQKIPRAGWSHSTPVKIDVNGKPQLIAATSSAVQGLDPDDGKLIWWAANNGDVPSPAFGNGLIYSESGRGGPGILVDPTGTGDVTKSHVKWKTSPIPEGYSSPTIAGEYVYRVHNPGVLKCWKMADGKVAYSERLPMGVHASASPILTSEGRLYFAGAGKSVVIPVGPKFEALATNDLGDGSAASPAVANGRLFLKGARYLYCIGKK